MTTRGCADNPLQYMRPLDGLEKKQLFRKGFDSEYLRGKSEYDILGQYCYVKTLGNGTKLDHKTLEFFINVFALDLYSEDEYTKFLQRKFRHTPDTILKGFTRDLVKYIIEMYWDDIKI